MSVIVITKPKNGLTLVDYVMQNNTAKFNKKRVPALSGSLPFYAPFIVLQGESWLLAEGQIHVVTDACISTQQQSLHELETTDVHSVFSYIKALHQRITK